LLLKQIERSNIKAFYLSKWFRIRDLADGEDFVDFGRTDDGFIWSCESLLLEKLSAARDTLSKPDVVLRIPWQWRRSCWMTLFTDIQTPSLLVVYDRQRKRLEMK